MPAEATVNPGGWSNEEMMDYIREHHIACPNCGAHDFTDIRQFNLMFKTFQGVVEDAKSTIYLRPETAQGMFVNFKNVQRSMRKKLPFGIGQIGKELPQRDHAGQLHLPYTRVRTDGAGVLYPSGRRSEMV